MATKYGTSGNDNPLRGTSGNDFLYGLAGDDLIITDDGDDYVEAGDGDDQVNGYPGLNGAYTYYNAKGNLTIYGGNGIDFLVGSDGNDKIYGDSGNDIIYGRGGNDYLDGGDGDDTLNAQSDGADLLYGGNGNDVLNAYTGTGDKLLDGGAGNDELYGGKGNDQLIGGVGDDKLNGNEGNDTIDGGVGNDTLDGGSGNDNLKGGNGNDRLITGDGNDIVYAGDGNDQINGYSTGEPNHAYKSWTATGDLKLFGEAGNDFIVGGSGADYISGGTEDDEIFSEEGNDTIYGDSGNDYISSGKGNDFVYGGDGNDRIFSGDGSDYIEGGNGDDEINSYIDADGQRIRWTFSGKVIAHGNEGNDVITGSSGDDELYGESGNDKLYGDDGNDSLNGGSGDDELIGGAGNDILDGGSGVNELRGGLGNDTYYVRNQQDFIQDTGGIDTAYVSTSFVKIPSTIEKVIYTEGAQALPYWIDALLPDEAAGLYYKTLLQNSSLFNYSFPKILPSYDKSSKHADGFLAFTADQISRTKEALSYISSLINLQFKETNDASQLNTFSFANNNQTGSAGYAQMPDDSPGGSDVFLNKTTSTTFTLQDGQYQTLSLMHEVGHALGLEHPFNTPSAGTGVIADPPYLTGVEDSTTWTVMSYTDSPTEYYLKYSPLDIAALQYIYGPSKTSRTGNDIYKISQSTANFIWDGAGLDTIDLSSVTQGATSYLTPGYWGFVGNAKAANITTAGQITVNFGNTIENLTGSPYSDKLYGNEVANVINGGTGNDLIEGWDGNDTLIGGQDDDQLNGGAGIDVAQFSGIWGSYSTVKNSTAFVVTDKRINQDGVDSLVNVERLKFPDKSVAIDLDGNAGITAKVIGAVLGKDAVKIPSIFGIGLSYADKGMSYSDLGALALNAVGASTNDAIVSTLWKNVLGFNASAADKAPFIKMLSDGMKPGDLVVLAADTSFNTNNIGLVGLVQTGVEYTPT